jgi:hemolysin III
MDAVVTTAPEKPKLRGVSHQVAAFLALGATVVLVRWARTPYAAFAAAIYGLSLTAMYTISALYHRPTWRPAARQWMRRADHAGIFVLIAGSYTPIGLLLRPDLGSIVLIVAWCGAAAGVLQSLFWVDAPKPLSALIYVALGWVSLFFMPKLAMRAGLAWVVLFCIGGAIYSAGAVVYAARRPNPAPRVFGYHEIFHVLVIVASICHFASEVRVIGLLR